MVITKIIVNFAIEKRTTTYLTMNNSKAKISHKFLNIKELDRFLLDF